MLNLTALKNVLTGTASEPTLPPSTPAFAAAAVEATPVPLTAHTIAAAEAAVKGKQLLRGRTRARAESLWAEVEAARASLAQLEQRVGECLVDERDATAIMEELRQADNQLRALEAALAVATQKDDAAQADLQHAEVEARREVLREKLVLVERMGKTLDDLLDRLKRTVEELAVAMNGARACQRDDINHQLHDAALAFKFRLLEACKIMPGCQTGYEAFLKKELWSASLPTPDQADRMK